MIAAANNGASFRHRVREHDPFCRMLGVRKSELLMTTVAAVTFPPDFDLRRFRGLFVGERSAYRADSDSSAGTPHC